MSERFYHGMGNFTEWPNIGGSMSAMSLTYDDVNLKTRVSSIESRSQVDLSVKFGPFTLTTPIVTAPMDTITGPAMVRRMHELGGIGSLPRNREFEQNLRICEKLSEEGVPCLYAIGLGNPVEEAELLRRAGAQMILLDVAQGGMQSLIDRASDIKERVGDIHIVAGNIASYEQAGAYAESGAIDIARVGVGGGGFCTTRLQSGVGVPQLSAIFDTRAAGVHVIADGGIRKPADVAKALAAGAEVVMIGSMFAGTDEAPGEEIRDSTGLVIGKVARGQASAQYMEDNGVLRNAFRTDEGVAKEVPLKGPVSSIVENITGGLRSACSYAGAHNLKEFYEKSEFIIASPAAAAEAHPHAESLR